MIIFPATDIKGGCAVRLKRGDFSQMKTYGDPLDFALAFKAKGAEYLHVVDLDGAGESGDNSDTIIRMIKEAGLKIQVGGGIRSREKIDKYLSAGALRVILGTSAATDDDFLRGALAEYKEKIAVGADFKDGCLAVRGWKQTLNVTVDEYFGKLCKYGCKTVICTDISKDGLLSGTNLKLYSELSRKYDIAIVASGGITTADDIKTLSEMNLYGAILGAALYENRITLEEALSAARGAAIAN